MCATKCSFITLAIDDEADDDVIRQRVTHAKARRNAFDHGTHWKQTCAEVAELRLHKRVTGRVTVLATKRGVSEKVVEAAGVEPASEDASGLTSTRVGTPFEVSSSPMTTDLRARQANFSRPHAVGAS